MKQITRDTSFDDILEDPRAYGIPTFEEFRKNKSKYMRRSEEEVEAIDRGDPMLGCFQRYYIEDNRGRRYGPYSLELIQAVAIDEGLNLEHDYIKDPQLRPDGQGGFYNEVTFRPNPNALVKLK